MSCGFLSTLALLGMAVGPLGSPAKAITVPLCDGGSLTIPLEDGDEDSLPHYPAKACHAVICRKQD